MTNRARTESSFMLPLLACDDKSCIRLNDLLDRFFVRVKLVIFRKNKLILYWYQFLEWNRHWNGLFRIYPWALIECYSNCENCRLPLEQNVFILTCNRPSCQFRRFFTKWQSRKLRVQTLKFWHLSLGSFKKKLFWQLQRIQETFLLNAVVKTCISSIEGNRLWLLSFDSDRLTELVHQQPEKRVIAVQLRLVKIDRRRLRKLGENRLLAQWKNRLSMIMIMKGWSTVQLFLRIYRYFF